MILSVDMWPLLHLAGEKEAMKIIKEVGFDGVDYPLFVHDPHSPYACVLGEDYRERAAQTKEWLDLNGLVCVQTHAPFIGMSYKSPMDVSFQEYANIVRSIEYSSIIGAKHIVIHGIKGKFTWDNTALNIKYYKSFEPYAKEFGVQIAVENLGSVFYTPELFNAVLDELDPEWFVGLVDVGHVNAHSPGVSPDSFIRKVRPGRIKGLHLHDNDGGSDQHLMPYLGTIRWDYVMEALADVGYDGDLTLEIGPSLYKVHDPAILPDMFKFAAAAARKMKEQLEAARREMK